MMRTTITIEKKLLDEIREMTAEASMNKAVNKALAEYVRLRKLRDLRDMIGHMGIADTWREDEDAELAEMRRMGHGPD
jgi:metal-responsive CopG/Arc/MetJ family transcriptional regulator